MIILKKEEEALIDNVINKVQIYMTQSNQNLFALANSTGFSYQPFYRLMKKNNLPTLSSLFLIASHFKCSIEELISEKIFIDIVVVDKIDNITQQSKNLFRIYLTLEEYTPYIQNEFIGVITDKIKSAQIVELYLKVNKFDSDGIFITSYNNKLHKVNVTSISSKFIITELNGEEEKISIENIHPIAKFFNTANCFKSTTIFGVQK